MPLSKRSHQVGAERAEFSGLAMLDPVCELERRLPPLPVSPGTDSLEVFLGGRVVGNQPREPEEDPDAEYHDQHGDYEELEQGPAERDVAGVRSGGGVFGHL